MNKYILLLGILSEIVFSQSECDGERYVSDIFPDVQLTSNIEYGENITEDIFGSEYTQTLYLDIYEPVINGGSHISHSCITGAQFLHY